MACFFRLFLLFLTFFSLSSAPLFAMDQDNNEEKQEKVDKVSLALGAGALAYIVYQMLPNPFDAFSRDEDAPRRTLIKKQEKKTDSKPKLAEFCPGYALVKENRIIDLQQHCKEKSTVKVGEQKNDYDIIQCKVVGQSGATCAYHALKNGLYISMLPFVAENDASSLQRILSLLTSGEEVKLLIGSSGPWWQAAGYREWLDETEINLLIKYENENKNILMSHQLKADNITIVENTDNIATSVLDEAFLPLCKKMRTEDNSLVHIFVVGNMTQYSEKEGSQGHWYTLVVNKADKDIQFLVSDSLDYSRLNDKKINKIITYLIEADCKPIAERVYFTDDITSLLDLAVKYIVDECNEKKEYSREEREKGIWAKIKKIHENLNKHKDEITQDTFVKHVTTFTQTLKTITTSNNYELVTNFKRYMDCLLDMRKIVNKAAHLQKDCSDDFDVSLKMWFIVKKMQKQKHSFLNSRFKKVELLKRFQAQSQEQHDMEIVFEADDVMQTVKKKNIMPKKNQLIEDIEKKLKKIENKDRIKYGSLFLKELKSNKKPDPKELLKLVSLYVNA